MTKDREMISIFPLWTFHLYIATLQQHLHGVSISQLIWYSSAHGSYHDFFDSVAANKEATEPMVPRG